MTKKNVDYSSWKVGDKVTSVFYPKQRHLVRKITRIERDPSYQNGFCVSADGGEPCPHCGNIGYSIDRVTVAMFEPYTEGQ